MKIFKILGWILFFPFMLTYFGWKKKNKIIMSIGAILSALLIIFTVIDSDENTKTEVSEASDIEYTEDVDEDNDKVLVDENNDSNVADTGENEENEDSIDFEEAEIENDSETSEVGQSEEQSNPEVEQEKASSKDTLFEGYTLIEVDGGDRAGSREANVVVDVGFGERDYWAFTNEYGQLVKVIAEEIILQDDDKEPVNENGRYYDDEAYVPGVESSELDQGHVIADSLGGVSSAYNITPQEYHLNRWGDQSYMEDWIRKAGGCTDFTAIITYPDTETQIPSHYEYTYTLNGNVITDSFDNVNPDEVNAEIIEEESDLEDETEAQEEKGGQVEIVALDKRAEYVTIENVGKTSIDISGWIVISVKGQQRFTFPDGYVLEAGQQCKLTSGDLKGTADFTMANTTIWNNSSSDPAELYNNSGDLIDRYDD